MAKDVKYRCNPYPLDRAIRLEMWKDPPDMLNDLLVLLEAKGIVSLQEIGTIVCGDATMFKELEGDTNNVQKD